MQNKWLILLSITILIVGVFLSLQLSFHQGTIELKEKCNQFLHSSNEGNYYGFEGCEDRYNETFIGDPLVYFYLTIIASSIPLYISASTKKQKVSVYLISVITFISLLILAQILLNTYNHVIYEGWQDAGWTIKSETLLALDFKELSTRPTALPFTIIVDILFSGIAFLGPLASTLLIKNDPTKNKSNRERILYYLKVLILGAIIQIVIFIGAFPINLWFGLSWG